MKRLTYKDASGKWVLNSRNFYVPKCGLPVHLSGEAVNCLAEYENTGYSSPQIIKLIEKQTPKAVVLKRGQTYICPPDCGGAEFDEYGDIPHCPSCDHKFTDALGELNSKFCHECGQKLDWF